MTDTTDTTTTGTHRGPLVLIPCSAPKRSGRHTAADLYTGSTFGSTLAAARSIVRPYGFGDECIRIVSAKHGLLRLDQLVDAYDVTVGDTDAVTTDVIVDQSREFDGMAGDVLMLLPAAYRSLVGDAFPDAIDGFTGTGGIGDQRGGLRRTRDLEAHRTRIITDNGWRN